MGDQDQKDTQHNGNDSEVASSGSESAYGEATWGPWLLRGVFVASLFFAWWLVIYDHGVASSH
ncbi:MAG: hypothetical protein OQK12_12810 [Motiliproteus sp.]|nr:hypothetical protein [Motiliproteus sp.]MCW9051860.1 hypothetical protein [Motiliproteus sp.]